MAPDHIWPGDPTVGTSCDSTALLCLLLFFFLSFLTVYLPDHFLLPSATHDLFGLLQMAQRKEWSTEQMCKEHEVTNATISRHTH